MNLQIIQLQEDNVAANQYSRRNNLRIFGIPEDEGTRTTRASASLEEKVLKCCSDKMNVQIKSENIDRVHRIGKKGDRPRCVIVKFTIYRYRHLVFSNKKVLEGSGVSVNEDLTKNRYLLYMKTVEHFGRDNVWTSDGAVMVNYQNSKHKILVDNDLIEMVDKFKPRV